MKSIPKGKKKKKNSHKQKENPNYNVFPRVFATTVWLFKIEKKRKKKETKLSPKIKNIENKKYNKN